MEQSIEFQDALQAKEHHVGGLLARPGVTAVGVGFKYVGGKRTDQIAVIVIVDCKFPDEALQPELRIGPSLPIVSTLSDEVVSVPTDVRQIAPAAPAAHVNVATLVAKQRPAPGGALIAAPTGSGTLGGWFWDDRDRELVFLSNKHVLGTTVGATVMQPLFSMDPTVDNRFGKVRRSTNRYDATIGAPDNADDALLETAGAGPAVYETTQAVMGMAVEKTGARTGHTTGVVTAVAVTTSNPCERANTAFLVDGDGSDAFSLTGDSGSLIFERTHPDGARWKRAVGLLYCATTDGAFAYGHQIDDVMGELELVTVCEALAPVINVIFDAILEGLSSSSMARDMEARMMSMDEGRAIVEMVHEHRAEIVQVLLSGDGGRAFAAALNPMATEAIVTDDVLGRVVDEEDVAKWHRFLDVAQRVAPGLAGVTDMGRHLLERAAGGTVAEVLGDRYQSQQAE